MQIGILMAGHTPETLRAERGDLDALFAHLLGGHGFTFRGYDVENMAFPESVTECDGWLITGSKHGVYEDHPFIAPLEAFIRDAHAADVPLVGICFGHQIVAQALGGRVTKFPGGWSLGPHAYVTDTGETVTLHAWHQDQVVEPPEGARVLARGEMCANAALAYGDRILTVQAHPEFDAGVIGHFIETRRDTGIYPPERLDAAEARLDAVVDNTRLGAALATFLKTRTAHV